MAQRQQLVRQEVDETDRQDARNDQRGWGALLKSWAIPVISVAAAAGAAYAVHQEHCAYEATREAKHVMCPNKFVPTEDLLNDLELEAGDLIEFLRTKFQHWGVYVGNGQVVHLNNDGEVQTTCIVKLARGGVCRINNLEPFAEKRGLSLADVRKSKKNVVKYAMAQVSPTRRLQYHVTGYNCEHFATECMYGTAFSEQQETLNGQFLARQVANVSARFTPYD